MGAEAETVWEQAFRVSSKRPPVDEHTGSRLLNFAPHFPPRPSHVYIDGLENRKYNVLPLRTHWRMKEYRPRCYYLVKRPRTVQSVNFY